ncbi:MAG: 3-phosphoserine/phosphohydroxythreonine transaminase [Planctomycetia bacterium]|nr:3-phosphoserine/phosphohydroxythreonine transaminase [Planctomycetia bacterium]
MQERVFNFSAGPAVLPLEVLEEAQRDLLALPGVGISVLEISHRSKDFQAIIDAAEANLRKLMNIPDNYKVLFLQGGASLQFGMLPMNLLGNKSADYIVTGTWSKKAMSEAKTQGSVRCAWDGSAENFSKLPQPEEINLDPNAAYVYYTSNETIQGVQFPSEPETNGVPLICDASSEFMYKPLDISKYGCVYACAQKNCGPAGVTIVVMREDLVEASPDNLISVLSYKKMAEAQSMLNTPPCFAIYIFKLVTDWMLNVVGGMDKMYAINQKKAALLYDVIDASNGFYLGHAQKDCRSIMNVPFKMATADLDAEFIAGAKDAGLVSLKGHRSVGGFRASIYNAMPIEGVERLAQFMNDFMRKHQ